MTYRDKLLAILASGGTYSLEDLRRKAGKTYPESNLRQTLENLVREGVVEDIDGAFRLVRNKGEKQKDLFP